MSEFKQPLQPENISPVAIRAANGATVAAATPAKEAQQGDGNGAKKAFLRS